MRDAIQGMLSMSRMQGGGCNSLTSGPWHPGAPKPKNLPALKLQRDGKRTTGRPEDNEKMPTCFKDEEYGENIPKLIAGTFLLMLRISWKRFDKSMFMPT